jgi:hypothetical protein
MWLRHQLPVVLATLASVGFAACSSSSSSGLGLKSADGSTGTGGSVTVDSATSAIDASGTGGMPGTTGTPSAIDAPAVGGMLGTGGAPSAIDAPAVGGMLRTGGAQGAIDAPSVGGMPGTGGTVGSGGVTASGGATTTSSGGSTAIGRSSGSLDASSSGGDWCGTGTVTCGTGTCAANTSCTSKSSCHCPAGYTWETCGGTPCLSDLSNCPGADLKCVVPTGSPSFAQYSVGGLHGQGVCVERASGPCGRVAFYSYVKNVGESGIANVTITYQGYTETKQFTVDSGVQYVLSSSFPVANTSTSSCTMSVKAPYYAVSQNLSNGNTVNPTCALVLGPSISDLIPLSSCTCSGGCSGGSSTWIVACYDNCGLGSTTCCGGCIPAGVTCNPGYCGG